ncbi:hypothetical protein [Naasia aerilata]|uniref:SCP domain-containing protein n=1 Tax=Naasia aerilata TaxID=1162966 RepID=A0ABN6XLH6_9MICO|nr:hypothetical protein [Naasia aerilata]BDZ45817.1 hypothetical protein GCM10025866_17260 [Naasia aerilata]
MGTALSVAALVVAVAVAVLALAVPGGLRALPGFLMEMPTFSLSASEPLDPAADDQHCSGTVDPVTAEAPGRNFADGAILGTRTADLRAFAMRYNEIRITHCLTPIPAANFRYDECMEDRLDWMASDPSDDPASAWGHEGSVRSDGVPSIGCDGNLAGGAGNTGATVAQKWWESLPHRAALYRPTESGPVDGVCIAFAMTHGGLPDEPQSFVRASAAWTDC